MNKNEENSENKDYIDFNVTKEELEEVAQKTEFLLNFTRSTRNK